MNIENKSFEGALKYSFRLLGVRPRTEKEIRARLERKGYSLSAAGLAISALKEKKLLDDLEFARVWIDNRINFRPRSKRVLQIELEAKGVDEKVIKKVLEERAPELEDKVVAQKLIERKLNAGTNLQDEKLKQKLFRFLVGKGIDKIVAEEVVNEVE